jgi:hypothetical protein
MALLVEERDRDSPWGWMVVSRGMWLDAEMPSGRRVRWPWDEDFPDGCRVMLVDEEKEKEPVGEDSGRPFLRGGSRKPR